MSPKSGLIRAAVQHPVASLIVGGFTVYAGYWGVMQAHWLVSHLFAVLLIASIVAGITVVTRKAKRAVSSTREQVSPISAEDVVAGWAPPVQGLPQGRPTDPIDVAYERVVQAARHGH